MRLEHYPLEKLKKEILDIIGQRLDLSKYRVFFFGSRILGRGSDRSDIDIGIEGPEEISGVVMSDIEEEIDNLFLLYKIEIVDFKKTSDDFREVALQTIEPIVL